MYCYLEKKEKSTPAAQKPIQKMKTTVFKEKPVMVTRSMARTNHSMEWQCAYHIIHSNNHIGRKRLYNFSFSSKAQDILKKAAASNSPNDPNTLDHIKPLCSLFEEEWPKTLYRGYREMQYNNCDNLRVLSRSRNSSKGSLVSGTREEYCQEMAVACMIFERLGCPNSLEDLLGKYGSGRVTPDDLLKAIEEIYDRPQGYSN